MPLWVTPAIFLLAIADAGDRTPELARLGLGETAVMTSGPRQHPPVSVELLSAL